MNKRTTFLGCLAVAVAFWVGHAVGQSGPNINELSRVSSFAVTNTAATTFTCPLGRSNFVQLSLNPGDAQNFTYCKPSGDCIIVPSGLTFELGPYQGGIEFVAGQILGTVQTATDGATLQVEAQRRVQ